MSSLNQIDRRLLELVQNDFPLEKKPWMKIGEKLNLEENEVLSRLKRLFNHGIIRKISSTLDARRMGFTSSTLIALRVNADRVQKVAQIINEYHNVSHNYQRDHEFNIWFTITALNKEELSNILQEIKLRANVKDSDVFNLPAKRLFKIDTRFNLR
jgi:DNA-binding Lrp family transcriptional regulator